MKKLLSIAMSIVLVFAFTPVTAFADVISAKSSEQSAEKTTNTNDANVGESSTSASSKGASSEAVSNESAAVEQSEQGATEQSAAASPEAAKEPETSLSTQETDGDFDKIGDYLTYYDEGTRFFYSWKITALANAAEGTLGTAEIYMVSFKYEDGDENNNGTEHEIIVPTGGDGSVDWTIPATMQSDCGNSYTVTSFSANLSRYEGGYCPIQFIKSVTVPKDIETIAPMGEPAAEPLGHDEIYNHVKSIAFESGSKVTELPNAFAHEMFYLDSVTLPENLETVGLGAFWKCFSLSAITLHGSLKTIDKLAFADTNIGSVSLPNGLETIGDGAFSWYDYPTGFYYDDQSLQKSNFLTSVSIPNTVKTIGSCAFAVAYPDSRHSQGLGESMKCYAGWQGEVDPANDVRSGLSRIESIALGEGVEEIGAGAFAGCIATEITIPASVKSIGQDAFGASSIAKVNWANEDAMQLKELGGFGECA